MSKKRRDAGDGSIYFSEDRDRWIAQLSLPNGQRKSLSGKTRDEVKKKLDKLKRERDDGLYNTRDGGQLFRTYAQGYLERHKHHLDYNTIRGYRQIINTWMGDIGDIPLNRLKPLDFQEHYTWKLKENSPATVALRHRFFRLVLDEAVEVELLPRNPCKKGLAPTVPEREYIEISVEQIHDLFAAARGHRWEAAYILAFSAGLREAEICGLCWGDINWQRSSVTVRHKLLRRAQADDLPEPFYLDAPKTTRSRRELPLPPYAITALQDRMAVQQADQQAIGDAWGNPWGLVFTNQAGVAIPHNTMMFQFRAVLRKARLNPKIRLHDLRHACATLLIDQGVPMPAVSEYLGHSSVTVTQRIYAHVTPKQRSNILDSISAIMPPTREGA